MNLKVGIAPPPAGFASAAEAAWFLAASADAGIDHVFLADHVSFRGGQGTDALLRLASLLGLHPTIDGSTGVYLLALRHPSVVARQLATIAELAPGRVTLGIGVGGDDPAELWACGIDPATRGRRTDEALVVLRALLTGRPVTHDGEFFRLDGVQILPAPDPPVPIVVGGRSDAALRRTGRLGDGWLATWCSARRYAEGLELVAAVAAGADRGDVVWRHGYQSWFGAGPTPADGAALVGPAMEAFYAMPFAPFERYTPAGPPDAVAEALLPFVRAGATTLNLTPIAASLEEGVAAVGEIKHLLVAELRGGGLPG